MMIKNAFIAMFCVLAPAFTWADNNYECARIRTVQNFDLAWFTQKTWFVHQMKTSGRYHDDENYCALMTFESYVPMVPLGQRFMTSTYAKSSPLSNINESINPFLCLTMPSTGLMTLGSCFFPSIISPRLYVVAMNKGGALGDWVIAVEGEPVVHMTGTCAAAGLCGNIPAQGMYIMTRQQARSSAVITAARAAALANGVCMDQMINVTQQGCSYQGAVIKK